MNADASCIVVVCCLDRDDYGLSCVPFMLFKLNLKTPMHIFRSDASKSFRVTSYLCTLLLLSAPFFFYPPSKK